MKRYSLSECSSAQVQALVAKLYLAKMLELGVTSEDTPHTRWMSRGDNWITITWTGEVYLSRYLPKANAPEQTFISLGILLKNDASKSSKAYVWASRLSDCLLMEKARFNGVDDKTLAPVYTAALPYITSKFNATHIASNRDGRTFLFQEIPGFKDGQWYSKLEAALLGFTPIYVDGRWYDSCISIEDVKKKLGIEICKDEIEVKSDLNVKLEAKLKPPPVIDKSYVDSAVIKRMESLIEGYEADIRDHKKEVENRMESIKQCTGKIETLREVIAKMKSEG